MALIALLTDFGTRDEYVGVMKGVIAGVNPDSRVVDICHHIEPQNIVHGAYILGAAAPFFPAGTVFVAIVDPGVGSRRRILAVDHAGRRFVAPDNGLLEGAIGEGSDAAIVAVENRRYFLEPVSRTFHGRDIFAPVAAHLAAGLPLGELGQPLDPDAIVTGRLPRCRFAAPDRLEGEIVAADRFGNLMTTVDAQAIEQLARRAAGRQMQVSVGNKPIGPIVATYDQVAKYAPLALIGSRGLLEISVNCGSARQMLPPEEDQAVQVQFV